LNTAAVFYFALLQCVLPLPAHAKLHIGTGHLLSEGGWDFSDSSYSIGTTAWDFGFVVTVATEVARSPLQGEELVANWSLGAGVQYAQPGAPFDSLLVAPDSFYTDVVLARSFHSYFIRTQEGHYARVELQGLGDYPLQFRFVYQDDGTTNLDTTVATRTTTWGRVKALYE
jgi:hypothetical protein